MEKREQIRKWFLKNESDAKVKLLFLIVGGLFTLVGLLMISEGAAGMVFEVLEKCLYFSGPNSGVSL